VTKRGNYKGHLASVSAFREMGYKAANEALGYDPMEEPKSEAAAEEPAKEEPAVEAKPPEEPAAVAEPAPKPAASRFADKSPEELETIIMMYEDNIKHKQSLGSRLPRSGRKGWTRHGHGLVVLTPRPKS